MSKRKLLLADDSITIQKVVNLTFADEGIEVISVGDGNSAMDKIAEISPDLIMADVNMPGLTGYEICEKLRTSAKFRQTPVILLVGSFEPFDEDEAKRVGADDYLTKPFQSIRQLVNKVTVLLNSDNNEKFVVAEEETVSSLVSETQEEVLATETVSVQSEELPEAVVYEETAMPISAESQPLMPTTEAVEEETTSSVEAEPSLTEPTPIVEDVFSTSEEPQTVEPETFKPEYKYDDVVLEDELIETDQVFSDSESEESPLETTAQDEVSTSSFSEREEPVLTATAEDFNRSEAEKTWETEETEKPSAEAITVGQTFETIDLPQVDNGSEFSQEAEILEGVSENQEADGRIEDSYREETAYSVRESSDSYFSEVSADGKEPQTYQTESYEVETQSEMMSFDHAETEVLETAKESEIYSTPAMHETPKFEPIPMPEVASILTLDEQNLLEISPREEDFILNLDDDSKLGYQIDDVQILETNVEIDEEEMAMADKKFEAEWADEEIETEPIREEVKEVKDFAFAQNFNELESVSQQKPTVDLQAVDSSNVSPSVEDETLAEVLEERETAEEVSVEEPTTEETEVSEPIREEVAEIGKTEETITETVETKTAEPVSESEKSPISSDLIDLIVQKVLEKLSDQVVREVVWEIVPQKAETIIREVVEEKLKE